MIYSFNNVALLILLAISSYLDVTRKVIPNYITIPSVLYGFITGIAFHGIEGFEYSVIGFLVGLSIFLVPFLLGGMGGGDVKLMAAIGALKGWEFVIYSTIFTGVVGGVIVIIILLRERSLKDTFKRVIAIILKPILFLLLSYTNNETLTSISNWVNETKMNWHKKYIPYGVAISIGSFITYFVR